MLGIKTITLSLLAAAALSAQVNYLPLDAGNHWVYRLSANRYATLRVERTQIFDDKQYSLLTGLPSGNAWLRSTDTGEVYAYNPDSKREVLWYDFSSPAGATYETGLPWTRGQAHVETRKAEYSGSIGKFPNALIQTYPGSSQLGIDRETFLPGIGLVARSEQAGVVPSIWDLVYASIGGIVVVSQPETSFAIGVDPLGGVRLTLRHTGREPLDLEFASGQMFDIIVKNDKGEVVYGWSSDKLFVSAKHTIRVEGEYTWFTSIPISGAGTYSVEAYLTNIGSSYRATVPFVSTVSPADGR